MRHFARPFVIPVALVWLLLLASVPAAFAQKRKTPEFPPAPPPVVGREVSVMEGESVTIPLGIHGRRTGQLIFLVRIPPRSGKLSAITTTGLNSATVTYTPRPNAGVTEDKFAYAVRSTEGVSAPGVVTIQILAKPKLPGRLEAPDTLAFPPTLIGEKSERSFQISNPGGGMVSGEITVSAPWSIQGDASYRLGPKSDATFKLAFSPDKSGSVAGEALLGPQPRRVIALTGEAKLPLVVRPLRLKLAASANGRTRSGSFEIENLSDEPQTIVISPDPNLMTEKTVEIAAGQRAQVPVFAEPGDGSAFQEMVRLSAGEWKHEVPVEVEAMQHRLKLAADPASALRGAVGHPVAIGLSVENVGGRAAAPVLAVSPPFALSESRIALSPGETKRIAITGDIFDEGEHRVEVTAETDAVVERLNLTYVATPDPNHTAAKPRPPSLAALGSVEAVSAPPPKLVREILASDDEALSVAPQTSVRMEEHPNAFGNLARATGPTTATLEWPIALGDNADLAVEERSITVTPDRQLVINWTRLASVTFSSEGDKRRAELTRLTPEKSYTVRVRGGGRTFFTAQFMTSKKPPLVPISAEGGAAAALFIVVIAVAWWRWTHRRRSAW